MRVRTGSALLCFALSRLQNCPAQNDTGTGRNKGTHPDLLELTADGEENAKNRYADDKLDKLRCSHSHGSEPALYTRLAVDCVNCKGLLCSAVDLPLGEARAEFLAGLDFGGTTDDAAGGAVLSDGVTAGENVFGGKQA